MPPASIEPGTALFVSDLHLSPATPAVVERFEDFLAGPARQAAGLFILGDLFDYWVGDDDLADPFNARVVSALRAATDAGCAIAFMAGNRDFLIGADFAAASGVALLPDPCLRDIQGTPTLLTHGDTLCTDDTDYQRFRLEVRSPAWRAAFLGQPLAERKRVIAALRARSETEKQVKPAAIMDVNTAAVATMLRELGARVLIHGHTHRQGCHEHRVDGVPCQRWVLGDWHATHGSVLACSGKNCAFESL